MGERFTRVCGDVVGTCVRHGKLMTSGGNRRLDCQTRRHGRRWWRLGRRGGGMGKEITDIGDFMRLMSSLYGGGVYAGRWNHVTVDSITVDSVIYPGVVANSIP